MVSLRVVVATTKVQIFKQITTLEGRCHRTASCCCYHKGTNFQANHNAFCVLISFIWLLLLPQRYKFSSKSQLVGNPFRRLLGVVATTKVQIFKQITTGVPSLINRHALLLLPQRYKFSSKSQPKSNLRFVRYSCCCYHKGTNFQANHNIISRTVYFSLLLLLPQRYKFSSKSQHLVCSTLCVMGCCWLKNIRIIP